MVHTDLTLSVCRIRQRRQLWIGNKNCQWIFTEHVSTYCQKPFMSGTEGASILIFGAMNVNNSLCRIYELFYLSVFPQSFHAVRLITLSSYRLCILKFGYTVHKMDMNCIRYHTRKFKAVTCQSWLLNFYSETQYDITHNKNLYFQTLHNKNNLNIWAF